LPAAAGDQLHAASYNVWTGVSNQKVNVVRCHDVIKYRKTEALLRIENPMQVTAPARIPKQLERLELSEAVERLERPQWLNVARGIGS
jgi:hypothetical protein